MTEAQFQSKVMAFLRHEDVFVIKYWGGGRFTKAGIPDIIACVNGYFVAIELKTETGRTSKLQDYNINRIRECGGIAIVLRPDKFPAFQKFIQEVKQCPNKSSFHIPE